MHGIEVDSEVYTCLWLTQKSFLKQQADHLKQLTSIKEIDYIYQKPRIIVLTDSDVESFKFLVGDSHQCRIVSSKPCMTRKRGQNEIFKKLFVLQDAQVPVRIGWCLLDSLIRIMNTIYDKIQLLTGLINDNLRDLVKNKDFLIKYFEKIILKSNLKINNWAPQISNRVQMRHLSKLLRKEIARKDLLVGTEISNGHKICQLDKKIESRLDIVLKKKNSFFNKNQFYLLNHRTPRVPSRRLTRSMTKERSTSKRSPTTRASGANICLTRRSNVFSRNDFKAMAKGVYAELHNFVTNFVDNHTKDLAEFLKAISDERLKRAYSLAIHEWKTVAMRNVLVKGFGYVGCNVYIYLKNDVEEEQRSVHDYLKKYLNDIPGHYNLQIGYKQQDEHAYSPDDNSKLGQNVFIHQSECNSNDKNDPYIDFSLVQVSPERTLTCTFGLKTTGGDFINGRIFRGDLSEICERNVYKWGATAPFLRKGKCIEFEDEGSLLYLIVDTKDFAKGGDSRSIVCVGEDVEMGLAAFVIVAGSMDDSNSASALNCGSSYLVYKVADALNKVSGMKPCLIPCTRTISISSPVSGAIQDTSEH
ncbi:unnamed protein product [Mytilus coruscus]|uniref:Uncharacterized protein n=1 Tax=Mytilus coruscus TaxID=42192 RepID=A0A6J7ZZI6_MYTCO|nr:unnamed protein product [Mytilus coruscus]